MVRVATFQTVFVIEKPIVKNLKVTMVKVRLTITWSELQVSTTFQTHCEQPNSYCGMDYHMVRVATFLQHFKPIVNNLTVTVVWTITWSELLRFKLSLLLFFTCPENGK